jgi:hypothetical protein
MSISSQMKGLREALGVENNAEVLPAVRALQQPKPQPMTLAVTWTPGTPELEASINVLSGGQVAFNQITAALRAALAVMDWQMSRQMTRMQQAQMQQQVQQQAVVAKSMEGNKEEQ